MRDLIRHLTRIFGLSIPLRRIYHRVFFAHRTIVANCAGITRIFATPTPTIAEQVRTLTGEGPVLELLLEHLKDQEVVWDVGAGFGLYALFASARLHAGSVLAFEPEPRIRELLSTNIGLNNAGNITVSPIALGDRDGEVGLFASDSPNVGTSALVRRTDYPVQDLSTSVRMLRGDSLLARGEAPAPAVLKIDVEGAEALVLAGLADTLQSGRVRMICCEVHPRLLPLYGSPADQFESFLTSLGFSIMLRHHRGTEYHLLCTRTP